MFTDEKGIHFDVEKFWDNDVFTVLQRWEDKVGDEEVDRAIKNVVVRWKEYVNKAGNDTALKIINHICGETVSKDEQTGGLLRQLLFVEIKGGKLESFLDGVVLEIQEEEQRRAGESEALRREPAPEEPAAETQVPEQAAVPELTDKDCIKKLVDTGFIVQNTNIKTKTIYEKTRAVTAPKIYRELLKITGDRERAERIMRNNISGVETGLKQYLSRISKANKT
jgi:hypothetical protein